MLKAKGRRLRQAAVCLFFVVLLIGMWASIHLDLHIGPGFTLVTPSAVSGDEPHYVLVLNSLVVYHQLELQDTYYRAQHVGFEANFYPLQDHHTIVVNRRTGRHVLWGEGGPEFLPPAPDLYEVSLHPMGYPALLAAFLMPFHPTVRQVQPDAAVIILLLAWSGALVTYFIARRVGMGRGLALGTTSLLALASPWLVYTKSFYSEPAIGLSLALALWALESDRPKLAALATGAATIFKPPFAVAGLGFIIERMWARRWRDAIEMSLVLAACVTALIGFNYWLARTPIIPVPPGWTNGSRLYPLWATLIGPTTGLFVFAPWTIFAFAFLGLALLPPWNRKSSVLRRIAIPTTLYLTVLVVVVAFPGTCYGPRYWVPFLPWLAIASVEGMRSINRPWPIRYALRISFLPTVILCAAFAIPGVLRYRQLFEHPPTDAWRYLIPEPLVIRPGQPGYQGDQYLIGTGTVEPGDSTLTTLSFNVETQSPSVMVVNRKYDKSWRLIEGKGELASSSGLVAVMVPAGKQHIVLARHDWRLLTGLGTVLYILVAVPLLWLYERSRAERS
jgi:hypothetical protein